MSDLLDILDETSDDFNIYPNFFLGTKSGTKRVKDLFSEIYSKAILVTPIPQHVTRDIIAWYQSKNGELQCEI